MSSGWVPVLYRILTALGGILIVTVAFGAACCLVNFAARKLHSKWSEGYGPRVVVWLQKGDVRGWLQRVGDDGQPVLTQNVFDRKVARSNEIEDDVYGLWRSGWVVSILRGWGFHDRFEARKRRDDKLARAAEAVACLSSLVDK